MSEDQQEQEQQQEKQITQPQYQPPQFNKDPLEIDVTEPLGKLPRTFSKALTTHQRRFLAAYSQCGTIRGAMVKAHIDTRYHYHWLALSNEYSLEFQRARDMFADVIEGEVIRRSMHGIQEPLSYKGQLTGAVIKKYSDTLAAIILKGRLPQYREGSLEGMGPQQINLVVAMPEQKQVTSDNTAVTLSIEDKSST